MKIMYVCKHNVFRSRVAEEHSKSIGLDAVSAGVIPVSMNFSDIVRQYTEVQYKVAQKYKLDIGLNSKPLILEDLRTLDRLIVVADDVPMKIFDNPIYNLNGKVTHWKIPDVRKETLTEDTHSAIRQIIHRINHEFRLR